MILITQEGSKVDDPINMVWGMVKHKASRHLCRLFSLIIYLFQTFIILFSARCMENFAIITKLGEMPLANHCMQK
jgi:hypothetical protein